MLQLAVQRKHERVLCQDTPGADGGRTLNPQQKYLALNVFCKGVWARARAQVAGYSCDGLCPKCGMPDSVRHRVWQCLHPEAVAARKSVTDDSTVEWLQEALESQGPFALR
eukprot:1038841-Pyramimonas_sp.AAC.1